MNSLSDAGLAKLTAGWGLSLRAAKRVRKVWRLETNKGVYCLKRSILNSEDRLFVETALRYLWSQGFRAIVPSLPSIAGACAIEHNGGSFMLYRWVESREADFGDTADLTLAVKLLTDLHTASRGFIPYSGNPSRVRWGLWPQILNARRAQLAEFGERAAALAGKSMFCTRYAHLLPYYYAEAKRALDLLSILPYRDLCRREAGERIICHHDFSARNILIGADGGAVLVDFDYCLTDLRLHDLANFVLRLLRHDRWRPETAASVLEIYGGNRPLDHDELAVLYPFLLWPQDFWQIGLQFFQEELPWSQERFIRTLRHKTEDRAERAAFLEWYAGRYL